MSDFLLDKNQAQGGLSLGNQSISYLSETRKWTFFLSILGLIFLGLIVFLAIIFATMMGSLGSMLPGNMGILGASMGGLYAFIFIVEALFMFFPIYYLFQFSRKMKAACELQDQDLLEEALKNLKSHYKFYGITMIVVLSFYAIGILTQVMLS